jgi:hypothetical protein
MATATESPARGKVLSVKDGVVTFSPAGTNYEMHLNSPAFAGPLNTPVKGVVRVQPKKIWTVPSGGLFVSPIFGPPKTIQGRIRALDETMMVIHAGGSIVVSLPKDDTVYDLPCGPLRVGVMVNVTAQPGATFEVVSGA